MDAIGSLLMLFVCVQSILGSGLYTQNPDVIELTEHTFKAKVLNSDELWFIEFYAPWCGHCKQLAPEWSKAASALKGFVKVGAVNMDEHQSVGGPYGIKGFPTIKIFGLNKNSPSDYNGGRTAPAIVEMAASTAKQIITERLSGKSGSKGSGSSSKPGNKEDVVILTDSNFEETVLKSNDLWLVEFYAPWCGHCKRLEPEWAKAATGLKGKAKLGALDATVHTIIASRYQIQGYPTIKVFPKGAKSSDRVENFDGGRDGDSIVSWALQKLAKDLPPPEVKQILTAEQVQSAFNDHQLSVVSFIPHILDSGADDRNRYLKVLRKMGDSFKNREWSWLWAEAGAQSKLEQSLGVGGFGYPAMTAINSRKNKFAILKGSFSDDGINEFLRALAVGRGSTDTIKGDKFPEIVESQPWDGKDGVLPEEEVDLSDLDLDEKKNVEL